MQVNLHDAKTHLAQSRQRQPGFLAAEAVVKADLKADFAAQIAAMFEPTAER